MLVSSGEEIENMSANQRPGQPSWISNRFKMIRLFFKTTRGTNVVNLVAWQFYRRTTAVVWKCEMLMMMTHTNYGNISQDILGHVS